MSMPNSCTNLNKAIKKYVGIGGDDLRMARAMANVVLGQMLPPGVVKGGSSLMFRYGGTATRYTRDVDTARVIDLDAYVAELEERLAVGWCGFVGKLVRVEPATPPSIPPVYLMMPYDIKLSYNKKPWMTIRIEVGHNEIGDADEAEWSLPQDVAAAFVALGFPMPEKIQVMKLSHQIAQKLHAVSEPGSARAHDLIDLQLIFKNSEIDLAETRRVCERLFAYRKKQPWPPKIVKSDGWDDLYLSAKGELPVLPTVDEAISWSNKLIARMSSVSEGESVSENLRRGSLLYAYHKIGFAFYIACTMVSIAFLRVSAQGNFELERPAYGDVLPQFGRNLAYVDKFSGERKIVNGRTVFSRLKDYTHPCILREPLRTVTLAQYRKWKDTRYVRRSMVRFSRQCQKDYLKELAFYEDVVASVAAECFEYRVKANLSQCVAIINKFYSQDFDRKWEGLPKWKKYRVEFDGIFAQCEDILHEVLDRLDRIHVAEFESWQRKNPVDYTAKLKTIEERIRGKELAIKMNRSIREAESAKTEAQNATAAARAAEARAAAAESAARDAESAARDAEAAAYRARNW